METLSPGFPLYLISGTNDGDGNQMAMTVDTVDKYAPRVTGVHNVSLKKWSGRDKPDTNQQWVWSEEDHTFTSVGVPGNALFEGFNKNIITYKYKGLPNQRFKYNLGTKKLENKFTGYAIDIAADVVKADQNISSNEPDSTIG